MHDNEPQEAQTAAPPQGIGRTLLHRAYGIYAIVLFLTLSLLAFPWVLLPLPIEARRQIAHVTARLFFALAGIRVRLLDAQLLPDAPCVVVANHASYLDGVVLKAMLPARFCFVIKKEIRRVPLAGLLLRRIGSEFVDRFNRHAGAMDARRLLKAADAGQALAFFPEGTFVSRPGVRKFHTGAFAIAARANLPVVPLCIRGTRYILPGDRLLPRPGCIDIHVLASLTPAESSGADVVLSLRDTARFRIVAALGEPDLSDDDGLQALQVRKFNSG